MRLRSSGVLSGSYGRIVYSTLSTEPEHSMSQRYWKTKKSAAMLRHSSMPC